MKLARYIADFLARHVDTVFAISGGSSLHLIHAIADRRREAGDIRCIYPHHEQAGGFAADGYARLHGMGCAIGTSGPGGTNMITAIAGCWFDSIPCLFITGQTASYRLSGESGVRQTGFQETDVRGMVKNITNYSAPVTDPRRIRFELEKAVWYSRHLRNGPVLLEICDDTQRAEIDPETLLSFIPPATYHPREFERAKLPLAAELLAHAQRPILVVGAGARESQWLSWAEWHGIPVAPTWAMKDGIAEDHPLFAGLWGTHGSRAGNFAVQNADLLIVAGSRLDTHMSGKPAMLNPHAAVVTVDIDGAEQTHHARRWPQETTRPSELHINMDAASLFEHCTTPAPYDGYLDSWHAQIRDWRMRYPTVLPEWRSDATLNPYAVIEALSEQAPEGAIVCVDTGCTLAWTMQAWKVKKGQRILHDWNNTAMGWALPAAIGAHYATNKPIICITGDGSLMMCLHELQTVATNRVPVSIFVMCNDGYGMNRQTQDVWFGGDYESCGPEGGLEIPYFATLAHNFGIPSTAVFLGAVMMKAGPFLTAVSIPRSARVIPMTAFGKSVEEMAPELPKAEHDANMLSRLPAPKFSPVRAIPVDSGGQ